MKTIIGFKGEIIYELSKSDGILRKHVDVSKINSLVGDIKRSWRKV